MQKSPFRKFGHVCKETLSRFRKDRIMKLSASLAFYTVFALPALLMVIISLTGIFFGRDAASGAIFREINALVGNNVALQVQKAINNMSRSGRSGVAAILGGAILLLTASGIFSEIQDSINLIWGLRAKRKKGLRHIIMNRLGSFSLVLCLGFILLVSLILNGVIATFSSRLNTIFPGLNISFVQIADIVMQVIAITLLFMVIFLVLPDAKVKVKDVWLGALISTVLFLSGKSLLLWYISLSRSIRAYGAAGSVLLLFMWVYFSSIILYTGAEFTQIFAKTFHRGIQANRFAVWTETHVVEKKRKESPEPEHQAK